MYLPPGGGTLRAKNSGLGSSLGDAVNANNTHALLIGVMLRIISTARAVGELAENSVENQFAICPSKIVSCDACLPCILQSCTMNCSMKRALNFALMTQLLAKYAGDYFDELVCLK